MEKTGSMRGKHFRHSASGNANLPRPFDQTWHVYVEEETYGPYTGHEIKNMAAEGQIVADDLVHLEGGSGWTQARQDAVLSVLFSERHDTFSRVGSAWARSAADQFRSPRRAALILSALALLATLWVVWPYYALHGLFSALRSADAEALAHRIDFPSVREGLRSDLNAMMLQKMKSSGSDSGGLGSGFAALLGPAIVNTMVDSVITPQGLATLVSLGRAPKPSEAKESAARGDDNRDQARGLGFRNVRYAFFSGGLRTFNVEVMPERDDASGPIIFRFNWNGTWQLTRITLPDDLDFPTKPDLGNAVATSTTQPAPKLPKQAEAPPLSVELISKNYRPSNWRNSEYRDNLSIQVKFKNLTTGDIRAFDGALVFKDLLDNHILSARIEINEPIKLGSELTWDGEIAYNQFLAGHQRIRSEPLENLKIDFVPGKVLFFDGKLVEFKK